MSNSPDTKQHIIDTAEHLFANLGYHNTSLRAITTNAQVNLAAVNYHFGSKEGLLVKVLERRILPLNQVRMEKLINIQTTAINQNQKPKVSEILGAIIEPTLTFRASSAGAQDFIKLVGRALVEPDDKVKTLFVNYISPLFDLTFNILQEALPETPKDVLFWRLHFTFAALHRTMSMIKDIEHHLTAYGLRPDCDVDTVTNLLIDFTNPGFEAKS